MDPFLFCEACLTGGCWLDEVMSGLEGEGTGNYAGFCLSSEIGALPFLTFSVSKWILDLFFTKNIQLLCYPSPGARVGELVGLEKFLDLVSSRVGTGRGGKVSERKGSCSVLADLHLVTRGCFCSL